GCTFQCLSKTLIILTIPQSAHCVRIQLPLHKGAEGAAHLHSTENQLLLRNTIVRFPLADDIRPYNSKNRPLWDSEVEKCFCVIFVLFKYRF
ncbi:MAG: hypothetical protein IJU39_04375, partial [Clostridia bacterium]|nr:hypothetical protein [Clostridia bacterium]